jgi:hypothetical protein
MNVKLVVYYGYSIWFFFKDTLFITTSILVVSRGVILHDFSYAHLILFFWLFS